jgi:hypothetical protein
MAIEYTFSPLGLIPSNKVSNPETRTQFSYFFKPNRLLSLGSSGALSSAFSNKGTLVRYSDGNGKHYGVHPLALNKVEDTHTDEIYDVSTANLITRLNEYPSMRLKWGDFAYCRDYGVYPNNRLIICRRFSAPVSDDLTFNGSNSGEHVRPISTLISWFKDDENPLDFDFGEKWEPADGSFKNLLNELGKDMGMKGQFQLGDILFDAAGAVPLPGITEGLQRTILGALGFIDKDTVSIIPSGTPNLIKESMRRALIKEDSTGSTLTGAFSVTVKCAWEQKFISNVDPTLVYFDILQTILTFGGSEAVFYVGKKSSLGKLDAKLKQYLKPGGAAQIVKDILQAFQTALSKVKEKLQKFVADAIDSSSSESGKSFYQRVNGEPPDPKIQKEKEEAQGAISKIIDSFVHTVIKKYRVQALGIVTTLTGLPSTPWHVTIGNPLRPIFCSGDMYTESVKVTLGPQLAYNDLPSYIEASFTLKSARNNGIDEIMTKLTCGAVRITKEAPSFWNKNTAAAYSDDPNNNDENANKSFEAQEAGDDAPSDNLQQVQGTQVVPDQFGRYEQEISDPDSGSYVEEDVKNTDPVTAAQALASGTGPQGQVGATGGGGTGAQAPVVTGETGAQVAGPTGEFPNLLPEVVIVAQRSPANSGQGQGEVSQSKVGTEPQNNGQVTNPQPSDAAASVQANLAAEKEKLKGGTGATGPQGSATTQTTQQTVSATGPQGSSTISTPPTTPAQVREDLKPTDVKAPENKGTTQKLDWQPGKLLKKGGYAQGNISVKWEVRQSRIPLEYNAFVDREDIGIQSNNLAYVTEEAKLAAADEFTQRGGSLPNGI